MLAFARLAILALSASSVVHSEPNVVLYLGGNLPDTVSQLEMKREFAQLVEPLAWNAEWRTTKDRTGEGESASLVVIRFSGSCSTTGHEASIVDGQRVASVQEVDGHILPFVDVDCDALVALIRPSLRPHSSLEQRNLLGRALGRVVAHEVYHVVSQARSHAEEGITRAKLSGSDLTTRQAQVVVSPHALRAEESFASSGTGGEGR